ncbi:CoA-binding protein [Alicyclobacillus acidiphilus]|uniref:CoA-binding protein n=1 Tax=Alicyclobacillus acidiphilus TaxID=182455 RepID=UPI00082FEBF3|nr:CoA-binding protein [Alicyclobacillus acidiphilus]
MPHVSDDSLANWLSDAHIIASVGVTPNPGTKAYRTAAYQQSQGYQVIPVNRTGDTVLGHPAVSSLAEIDGPVDIVNVPDHVKNVEQIADDAIQAGAKVLWFESGAHDHAIDQRAEAAGVHVVKNRNFEREHRRLLSAKEQ